MLLLGPSTRHLDILMEFYSFTTITFTLMLTQYIPESLKKKIPQILIYVLYLDIFLEKDVMVT